MRRTPFQVTIDRLWSHIERHELDGEDRDALTAAIERLEALDDMSEES